MSRFQKAIADCGMPVYVYPMSQVPTVATGILVNAGSKDEHWPEEAGLAHAFEHMVFRGNKRFPTSKEVAAFIEETGGDCNAWTSKEMTFFHNAVPAKEAKRAITYLYNLLVEPKFSSKNIKPEMKVVLHEINEKEDDPEDLSAYLFEKIAYGSNPLGRPTLGIADSVKSFRRKNFLDYQRKFYHANNFSLLIAGNITLKDALKMVNQFDWPKTDQLKNIREPQMSIKRISKVMVINRDIEQLHICIGAPIGSYNDPTTTALSIFTAMIAGGMSFPLFQEVRDKLGLCYTIKAGIASYADRGLFQIYTKADPLRHKEVVEAIKKVISKCSNDKDLLRKAKKLLLGSLDMSFESPGDIIDHAAEDIILEGHPRSIEEIKASIKSVKIKDVTEAVEKYLNPDSLICTYVGPEGFKL